MSARISLCLALFLHLSPAAAAELRVSSAVSLRSVLEVLIPAFEKDTGNHIVLALNTSVALKSKIEAGERFDVAILSPNITRDLEQEKRIVSGAHATIATTVVAVGCRIGATKPTISTPADLKSALINAKSIASSDPKLGGASAVQLQKVIRLLGIQEQIAPKLIFTPGGAAARAVADGNAELAVGLTSEIVPVKGVQLVGPFPETLQFKVTLLGAVAADTAQPEAAKTFLQFLHSPAARTVLEHNGMGST